MSARMPHRYRPARPAGRACAAPLLLCLGACGGGSRVAVDGARASSPGDAAPDSRSTPALPDGPNADVASPADGIVAMPPSGCGPGEGLDPASPWPAPLRCGSQPDSTPVLSVDRPEVRWMQSGQFGPSMSIGRDGTLYVQGPQMLEARSPDGTLEWTGPIAYAHDAPVIAADGTLYYTGSSELFALAPDGKLRWRLVVGNAMAGPPLVAHDGTIFVGTADGSLHAVTPDGRLRQSTPGVAKSGDCAIGGDGTLYYDIAAGINAVRQDGSLVWSAPLLGQLRGLAIAFDGSVYAQAPEGLLQLAPSDGRQRWSIGRRGVFDHSLPALAPDGTVHFGAPDGGLYSFGADGKAAWTSWTGGKVAGNVLIAGDGTTFFGSGDDNLYAVAANGKLKWKLFVPGANPVAIGADGTLYVRIDARERGLMAIGCAGGRCGSCRPSCDRRRCGDDGCGGSCGACAAGETCHLATHLCQQLAATAGACGDTRGLQPGSPWPLANGCSTRAGLSPVRAATNPATQPRWTLEVGRSATSPVVAADGTIYVGTSPISSEGSPKLVAIAPSGQQRWAYASEDDFVVPPAIGADGTLFAPTSGGPLVAIGPDGSRRWLMALRSLGQRPPAIAGDGTLYVVTIFGDRLVALDPSTGAIRWTASLPGASSAPTVGSDGTIWVARDGALHAFSPAGAPLREVAGAIDAVAPMAAPDGTIYVVGGARDAKGVSALRPAGAGATERWHVAFDGASSAATPALGRDGSIIVSVGRTLTDVRDHLYALDPADGRVRWSRAVPEGLGTSPLIDADGGIYAAAGHLSAFDASGKPTWLVPVGFGTPALGPDGTIYVTAGSKLHAFGP
jgi:outer membrane protein assembly factor BamB